MSDSEPSQRFTAMYDSYYRNVYAYAVSRVGRQAAEEVASDTFLVAWRRWQEVPAAPLPWLLGVARNVIRDQCKRADRQQAVEHESRGWAATQARDPADEVMNRAVVLSALASLTDDDRELLTLVAWHGLSSRQVAHLVGCSTAAYLVRLHRARRRLENAISSHNEPLVHVETQREDVRQ